VSNALCALPPTQGDPKVRRITIIPALALSFMSLGVVVHVSPASAHTAIHAGEDGDDSTPATTPSASGGSGSSSGGSGSSTTPSGGISTGAGGTALGNEHDPVPWLATGAAGVALVGASVATRRRRALKA
jgi:hypothetical protein